MAEEAEQDGKEFEPSARRLERAREEGDAIRSEELQAAVSAMALVAFLAVLGGGIVTHFARGALAFLDRPQELSLLRDGLAGRVYALLLPVLAVILIPGIAVLIWLIASRGLVLAPSKLALKPSRISILSNAKQKFGLSGLVDFGRRSLKLLAVAGVLVLFLQSISDALLHSMSLAAGQVVLLMLDHLLGFLWVVVGLGAAFGLVDFLWQRHQFLRRNRMTRKEMTDEMKDSEGDPHLKADRRRRAQEVANRKMLVDVPKADVVIVNPTHYAVALKWDRRKGRAPICVAKGVDEMAARMREIAQTAGVPLHRDPPTARLLHAALQPGQEIRVEHYAAVAAAIRFADAMRQKAKRGGWR